MDVLEAYDRTMQTARELEASGIPMEFHPSDDQPGPEEGGEELPRHLWGTISFHPKDEKQAEAIHKKADELGRLGITFDTGGTVGLRDWEVDWSFHAGKPDPDWKKARAIVEDVIETLGLSGRVTRSQHVTEQ